MKKLMSVLFVLCAMMLAVCASAETPVMDRAGNAIAVPEKIEKIVYMPRNDDNFIRLGDQYELFYQDGFRGWISLGRQVASELTLHYDNIPKNSVLWLRNLSRGREETVFRNEDGRQVFFVKW